MQLAMLRRDSGDRFAGLVAYGSEWTVAVRLGVVFVALLVGARQQLLCLGDMAPRKVGGYFGTCCYSLW